MDTGGGGGMRTVGAYGLGLTCLSLNVSVKKWLYNKGTSCMKYNMVLGNKLHRFKHWLETSV